MSHRRIKQEASQRTIPGLTLPANSTSRDIACRSLLTFSSRCSFPLPPLHCEVHLDTPSVSRRSFAQWHQLPLHTRILAATPLPRSLLSTSSLSSSRSSSSSSSSSASSLPSVGTLALVSALKLLLRLPSSSTLKSRRIKATSQSRTLRVLGGSLLSAGNFCLALGMTISAILRHY